MLESDKQLCVEIFSDCLDGGNLRQYALDKQDAFGSWSFEEKMVTQWRLRQLEEHIPLEFLILLTRHNVGFLFVSFDSYLQTLNKDNPNESVAP